MSNPFKAIGKVFKSVVKVVKKVALPALMIGAVVLTGGAALGALPALGTILGSVGISGTLASVLGGAISMGAVGAVGGFITGGMKGAKMGFLGGALTGGVLGGVGVIGANGVFGANGLLGMGQGSAATSATGAVANTAQMTGLATPAGFTTGAVEAAIGAAPTLAGAAPLATQAAAAGAGVAGGTGGGLLGQLAPTLLQGAGQIISGFSQGKMAEAQMEAEAQAQRDRFDRTAFNYGYRNIYGDDDSNIPSGVEQWYQYQPHNFAKPGDPVGQGLLHTTPSQFLQPQVQYQIVNGQVVPVPVGAG